MKTWIFTLPLVCAVGVAMAQGVEQEGTAPAAAPAEAAAAPAAEPAAAPVKAKAPAKAKTRGRTAKRGPKTLPKGDLRQCLDLKGDAEIIRCSETPHKK